MKLILLLWSSNFFIVPETAKNQVTTFAIANRKLYLSVATLSNQDNIKLLRQSCSKRTINCNKHQSKVSIEAQNRYLDFWVDLNFWELADFLVYRLKTKLFEQVTQDFLPTVK